MFERCTRILAGRWGLLVFGLGEAVMLTFWLAHGRMPQANRLVVVPGLSMATSRYWQLPVAMPRLLDPVFAVIPIVLLVWAIEQRQAIVDRYASTWNAPIGTGLLFGVFFGICGWWVVGGTGIGGATGGMATTCAAILFFALLSWDARDGLKRVRNLFIIELVAVDVLWGLLILSHGIVAASFFAVICLAVAMVVHFGVPLLIVGFNRYTIEPFTRAFLTCPVEEASTSG